MRRWLIVAAAVLSGTVLFAQIEQVDWSTYRDRGLAAHPCGGLGLKGAASLAVIDGAAHVLYTCANDSVIVREFAVQVQAPAPPAPMDCSHIPGFVSTQDGTGCVPPDHPLARR